MKPSGLANHVFIVGAGRSGSSLLQRIIQLQPNFCIRNSHSGLELTETKVFHNPLALFDSDSKIRKSALDFFLGNEDVFDEFLHATRFIRAWQKALFFLPSRFVRSQNKQTRQFFFAY